MKYHNIIFILKETVVNYLSILLNDFNNFRSSVLPAACGRRCQVPEFSAACGGRYHSYTVLGAAAACLYKCFSL